MCIDALDRQLIQFKQRQQFLYAVCGILSPEANASHAGVQFDVTPNDAVRMLLQLLCIVHGQHTLDDILLGELRCIFRRCIAQDENLCFGAVLPYSKSFFQVGNGKPMHAQFPEFPADGSIAVSIGIRLDHCHHFCFWRKLFLYSTYIVFQCTQVNFCPSTVQ